MACTQPLTAWRGRVLSSNGKRKMVFNAKYAHPPLANMPIKLACGQCPGCKLERSRQWAIRCVHEASLHTANTFITLTYDDQHLPPNGSLQMPDFQDFMKRLRWENKPKKIRFYHCGEYGEKFGRPHYHAILFNHEFTDQIFETKNNGVPVYQSKSLTDTWGLGRTQVGTVTFQSAAYVARYIMKKINGEKALQWYENFDPQTGEQLENLAPEYTTMSLKKGLGLEWLNKYASDVYPCDFVIIDGKKMRPPKYYDRNYELTNPTEFGQIKERRKAEGEKHKYDQTPERLKVKEICLNARIKNLPRSKE